MENISEKERAQRLIDVANEIQAAVYKVQAEELLQKMKKSSNQKQHSIDWGKENEKLENTKNERVQCVNEALDRALAKFFEEEEEIQENVQ